MHSVHITWERTVRPLSAPQFVKEVSGERIESIGRRGKYIIFELEHGAYLLTHLRMTGQYQLSPPEKEADPHVRVEFKLDQERRLRFHDTRKFGQIIFTRCPGEILDKLGPDPFDPKLTPDKFASAVHKHSRQIKALLLDQSFLAGLGNIYCDEALFAAGVHPLENSRLIEPRKAEALLLQIRTVLRQGLRNRGTSLGEGETNYISGGKRGENREALRVYGLKGRPCPRCGTPIEKIYVAQRGSYFCPRCQSRTQESSSK
ncbi:MAG: DNA-formamidopyrimidine glycosylase [Spirochaetia bacterium]|nr:DNA-formamidopyrimidine glycosylase [Spirochaetia bacterium]